MAGRADRKMSETTALFGMRVCCQSLKICCHSLKRTRNTTHPHAWNDRVLSQNYENYRDDTAPVASLTPKNASRFFCEFMRRSTVNGTRNAHRRTTSFAHREKSTRNELNESV